MTMHPFPIQYTERQPDSEKESSRFCHIQCFFVVLKHTFMYPEMKLSDQGLSAVLIWSMCIIPKIIEMQHKQKNDICFHILLSISWHWNASAACYSYKYICALRKQALVPQFSWLLQLAIDGVDYKLDVFEIFYWHPFLELVWQHILRLKTTSRKELIFISHIDHKMSEMPHIIELMLFYF